jgi:hypothetical protein
MTKWSLMKVPLNGGTFVRITDIDNLLTTETIDYLITDDYGIINALNSARARFKEGDAFFYKGFHVATYVDGLVHWMSRDNGMMTEEEKLTQKAFNKAINERSNTMATPNVKKGAAPVQKAAPAPKEKVEKAPKEKVEKVPKPQIDHDAAKRFKSFCARIKYMRYMDFPSANSDGLPGLAALGWKLLLTNSNGQAYTAVSEPDGTIKLNIGNKNVGIIEVGDEIEVAVKEAGFVV